MQTIKSEEAPKAAPAGAAKEVELPQGGDKEAKEVTDATEEKKKHADEEKEDTEEEKKDDEEEVKPPRPMTMRELLILLKPFFWPDSGTDGAVVNRIRACSTWFCVVASRVCGVYSPFFIETATNELVDGNLEAAWIATVGFVMLRIGASMFKELQGMLYVKVKQQASVQLTLQTFVHG